jgi:hypothetical protein
MTRIQRNKVVEAHAELIMADEHPLKAYAAYFETQMHCGRARRLLYTSYLWLARAGTLLTGFWAQAGVPRGHDAVMVREAA